MKTTAQRQRTQVQLFIRFRLLMQQFRYRDSFAVTSHVYPPPTPQTTARRWGVKRRAAKTGTSWRKKLGKVRISSTKLTTCNAEEEEAAGKLEFNLLSDYVAVVTCCKAYWL